MSINPILISFQPFCNTFSTFTASVSPAILTVGQQTNFHVFFVFLIIPTGIIIVDPQWYVQENVNLEEILTILEIFPL